MSVAYGVSWDITHRLNRIRDPAIRHLVNVGLINTILVLLTIVVTTAMLAQTAAATFTFGVTVMNARREEVAIRRQSGVLRSTLLREFMLAMLVPCVAGGLVGETTGIFAAVLLRTYTVLPIRFNAIALLGAFPVTVILALLATLIPGWRFANASPALLRRG
jgi:ABC-type lipoprotein release transport system permease subunit